MSARLVLPHRKQIDEEAVDRLLPDEVTAPIKLPHLAAHLDENVHLKRNGYRVLIRRNPNDAQIWEKNHPVKIISSKAPISFSGTILSYLVARDRQLFYQIS